MNDGYELTKSFANVIDEINKIENRGVENSDDDPLQIIELEDAQNIYRSSSDMKDMATSLVHKYAVQHFTSLRRRRTIWVSTNKRRSENFSLTISTSVGKRLSAYRQKYGFDTYDDTLDELLDPTRVIVEKEAITLATFQPQKVISSLHLLAQKNIKKTVTQMLLDAYELGQMSIPTDRRKKNCINKSIEEYSLNQLLSKLIDLER